MAKGTITASTVATNTIQSLADVVTGQATALKTKFDKGTLDTKTYINDTLIAELNGDDGSKKIGHASTNIAADNVNEALEELYESIIQSSTGDILDNSLGNIKLANDVKVGSLAALTTSASSVTGAINAIDTRLGSAETTILNIATNKTLLDITRTAVTATGSNVAMAVDTVGTFDVTLNGNILHVVPNSTNVGSMTIAVDGLSARTIKKANDSGVLVDLEVGDIKAKSPILLVRDSVNDFFVLALKDGLTAADKANLIPTNIKEGITIKNVTGTMYNWNPSGVTQSLVTIEGNISLQTSENDGTSLWKTPTSSGVLIGSRGGITGITNGFIFTQNTEAVNAQANNYGSGTYSFGSMGFYIRSIATGQDIKVLDPGTGGYNSSREVTSFSLIHKTPTTVMLTVGLKPYNSISNYSSIIQTHAVASNFFSSGVQLIDKVGVGYSADSNFVYTINTRLKGSVLIF